MRIYLLDLFFYFDFNIQMARENCYAGLDINKDEFMELMNCEYKTFRGYKNSEKF